MDNKRKKVDCMLENYYSKYDLHTYEKDIQALELEYIAKDENKDKLNSLLLLKYTAQLRNNIIYKNIRNLSEKKKNLMELRYKNRLTNKEIAIKLNVSNRNVSNEMCEIVNQCIIPKLEEYDLI